MRCIALAQAWQDRGGDCTFAFADCTATLRERLCAEGFDSQWLQAEPGSKEDASELVKLARPSGAEWVVVDGYQFDGNYQDQAKSADLPLVFIDDNGHADHYSADLVLNQNVHASAELYPRCASHTGLLLGSNYALLRREFAKWSNWKREITGTGRNILVTMGGSDPDNITGNAIRGLMELDIPGLSVVAVVGGGNPHAESLKELILRAEPKFQIQVNPNNMPELMAWADLAISAAGSTCWEMCRLGLPAIVVPIAQNQSAVAARLTTIGAVQQILIGQSFRTELMAAVSEILFSIDRRQSMSQIGRSLVDGQGASRVLSAMRNPVAHMAVH